MNIKLIFEQKNNYNKLIALKTKELDALNDKIISLENKRRELMDRYLSKGISKEIYVRDIKELDIQPLIEEISDKKRALRRIIVLSEIVGISNESYLKNIDQLGENISNGGSHSKGVFVLKDNPKFVAKELMYNSDEAIVLLKYTSLIKSPRVMKTVQYAQIDNRHYVIQSRAVGKPMAQLNKAQFAAISEEHRRWFHEDLEELRSLNLTIDPSGGKINFFYHPDIGIQIIDLGIGKMSQQDINDWFKLLLTSRVD